MGESITAYVLDNSLPMVSAEDARILTHLNIAFALVRDDRIVYDHLKNIGEIDRLRRINPCLKIMLSVGGWGADGFSQAASTQAGRMSFAQSCARAVYELDLDGINLDWEYPTVSAAGIAASPADRTNFTLLLGLVRAVLNACAGRRPLMTIAAGAGDFYLAGTQMDIAQQYLDYVLVMTYDLRGGIQTFTGHHTNLYDSTGDLFLASAASAVHAFLRAGVPRQKIMIGAAFYARKWTGVPDRNRGLHQTASSVGEYGGSYDELVENYINKNGFIRYWDEEAKAPWLFNGETFISYDDERSICCKCEFILEQGLAGIMFWEYSGDTSGLLIKTMRDCLYTYPSRMIPLGS